MLLVHFLVFFHVLVISFQYGFGKLIINEDDSIKITGHLNFEEKRWFSQRIKYS